MKKKQKVIIVGGGVAGMSAAHEFALRNEYFDVEVYEQHPVYAGGKARSIQYFSSQINQHLPAEHGFRFFPGFYVNLDETMKQIPLGNGKHVIDNLVEPEYYTFLFPSENENEPGRFLEFPVKFRLGNIRKNFRKLKEMSGKADVKVTREGVLFFAKRVLQLFTSSRARIDNEYEAMSWLEFVEGGEETKEEFGEDYQYFMAEGLTRNLV